MPNRGETQNMIEREPLNTGTANSLIPTLEKGNSVFHQTKLTFSAFSVAMTDHTTAGSQGSVRLYTFPKGLIRILGVRNNLAIARVSTNITATALLVGAIGTATVGVNNASLTTTEADIVGSTALSLTAGAVNFTTTTGTSSIMRQITDATNGTATTAPPLLNSVNDAPVAGDGTVINNNFATILTLINSLTQNISILFDGTATAKDAYLNFAIPDAGSTGDDAITLTGTITISWEYLSGDPGSNP